MQELQNVELMQDIQSGIVMWQKIHLKLAGFVTFG